MNYIHRLLQIVALLLFTFACNLFTTPDAALDAATETPEVSPLGQTPSTPAINTEAATLIPGVTETVAASATNIPAPSLPDPNGYQWELFARGFTLPLGLTHAGDGNGRIYIVEQRGMIHMMIDGQLLPEPYLDIRDRVGDSANEQGLLGLAFHPQYTRNVTFFVNYTDLNGNTVISRFTEFTDPSIPIESSEVKLLQISQPYANHNGGGLAFGPDGYLYIGLGDGGSAGDPQGNAQSLDTLLGKMLRIDVDNGTPYSIPADNPYVNGGGRAEIWASGLRNPWRFSFDALTGDLYIADVGQNIWEEVNFLPNGIVGGLNLGWDYLEGNHPYQGSPPPNLMIINPVAEYSHNGGHCSITGGQVYRGSQLPEWQGVYIYGDFCSGYVWGLVQNANGEWQSQLMFDLGILISSFGSDENGEIYTIDRNGNILKLTRK